MRWSTFWLVAEVLISAVNGRLARLGSFNMHATWGRFFLDPAAVGRMHQDRAWRGDYNDRGIWGAGACKD